MRLIDPARPAAAVVGPIVGFVDERITERNFKPELRHFKRKGKTENLMSLRERLIRETSPVVAGTTGARANAQGDEAAATGQRSFQEMKSRLHRAIINRMDLTKLGQLEPEQLKSEVSRLAEGLIAVENAPLSANERERLVEEVRHEL